MHFFELFGEIAATSAGQVRTENRRTKEKATNRFTRFAAFFVLAELFHHVDKIAHQRQVIRQLWVKRAGEQMTITGAHNFAVMYF